MHLRSLPGLMACRSPADAPGGAPAGDTPAATPPADPPATPPAGDPPPSGDAPPPPPPPPEPPKPDWKDARIKELTAKLNAEKARVAATPAAPPPPAGETPEAIQARIDAAANEKAAEIAAAIDWNNRCNAVNAAGLKEFPDFPARLAGCQSVVNGQDINEVAQFNAVIAAAMETGAAHKLLHALGETPGEVKRLMGLSPTKMAMELGMKATKLGAPPAEDPSDAPPPITPIGSMGKHYDGLAPDTANGVKLPIGEWMKRREKQAEAAGIQ